MSKWGSDEIDFLKANINVLTNREISQNISKTIMAIKRKMNRLGLKRDDETIKRFLKFSSGRDNRGENNPNWKGGISANKYHYKKLQVLRYPEKIKAREKLNYHVKRGNIKKGVCVVCGSKDVHGHHEDYSKPLEVVWLCRKHHREIHGGKH